MKRLATLGFAVLLLGFGLVAWADGPGGHHKGMRNHEEHLEHMAKLLGLTDEQKIAGKKIHEEVMAKAGPLQEQHRQLMEEVHALLEGDNPDPAEVGRKMIAAHAAKQQLGVLHEDAMARFGTVLNAEQLEKLKTLHQEHMGHGRFHHEGHGDGGHGD